MAGLTDEQIRTLNIYNLKTFYTTGYKSEDTFMMRWQKDRKLRKYVWLVKEK